MPNLTNHYRNLDAHTPIRFTTSLSAAKDNSVRKQPQRQTLMQPHCVLQHHTWQTHMYLTHRNWLRSKRPRPHPRHTRAALHRRLQPLKHKVSCSGFLPNPNAMQHSNSCSHYDAFCSSTCALMQPLQCDLHPRAAEHQRFSRNDHSRNRRNRARARARAPAPAPARAPAPTPTPTPTSYPSIAGRSHFTRKNTRFRAPASSPKQTLCNNHAAITMRFEAARVQPACLDTHGNKTRQQSCSHSTAICKPILRHHHFTTLRHHHSPSAPLPSVTTLVITSLSHHPSFMWCTVKWCKVSQFYLFVTRKIDCFPTSLDKSILILLWSFWGISYISVMRLARVIGVPGFAWKTWPRFFLGNAMINIIQYLSLIWDISQRCLWHHEKQSKADQQKWENNLTWTYCNISKIHEDMTWAPLATMAGHSRVALTWKSFGWTLCKHCAALFSAPNPNSTLEEGCWRRAKIKTITMLTCRCEVGGWWRRVARYKACVCEHLSPLLKTWVFIQQHTAL